MRILSATITFPKERGTLRICGVVAVLAVIIPRFVPNQEGGFASAATAILVFLGLLFGAAVLSLYLLLVTIKPLCCSAS